MRFNIKLVKWVYILIALFVFLSPHIFMYSLQKINYSQEEILYDSVAGNADYAIYAGRSKEFVEGKFPTKVYLKDHIGFPFFDPPLAEIVMGATWKLFNNLNIAFIFWNVSSFLIIFYLIYSIVNKETNNQYLAILCSFLVLIAGNTLLDPWNITNNLSRTLPYFRFIHPGISGIFLFLGLFGFYKLLDNKSIRYLFLTGIIFGLLFYQYVYFAAYFIALHILVITLATFWLLYNKKFKEIYLFEIKCPLKIIKRTFLSLFIGLVIAIPYFINLLFQKLYFPDIMDRLGIHNTRNIFSIGFSEYWLQSLIIILIGLAVFSIFLIRNKNFSNQKLIFTINLFFLAGIASFYSTLITGISMHNTHWFGYIILQFFFLTLTITFFSFKTKKIRNLHKKRLALLHLLIIFLLIYTSINTFAHSMENYDQYCITKTDLEIFKEIDSITPKEATILSNDPSIVLVLPIYTDNNIFSPRAHSKSSSNELRERFLIKKAILKTSSEDLKTGLENLTEKNSGYCNFIEQFKVDSAFIPEGHWFIDEKPLNVSEISWYIKEYNKIKSKDYKTLLVKFNLDFILLKSPKQKTLDLFLADSDVYSLIYEKDGYYLFSIKIKDLILD